MAVFFAARRPAVSGGKNACLAGGFAGILGRLKILLINQTFYPDVAATAQYLTDLATALAGRGHEVTVVTGRTAYDDSGRRFAACENWRGITIHRVDGLRLGKGAKWRRALDFASFLGACGLRLARLPRADVVVTLTSPPLISVLGAVLARWWRSRFVYWVMDFNPDEAIAAGWLRADSPAGKIMERLSRFSLRRADKIIVLDRFMSDRIAAKGIAPGKIAVIPPGAQDETVRFDAAGRERFHRAHGLTDKFVVMYSGNHSPCHPLDTLLAAARELRGEPGVVFLFVGGGSEFGRVKTFAAEQSLANILCLPYQPLAELAGALSAADLQVVVMGDAFVGTIHPCKIYNILAVAVPVLYIGPQPSHVTEILAETETGWGSAGFRHGEAASVARHIRQLREAVEMANVPNGGRLPARFTQAALLPQLLAAVAGVESGAEMAARFGA